MKCTYPDCMRLYGGCGMIGCGPERKGKRKDTPTLHDALMDSGVSCTGKTITIECGSHDSKDVIMNYLTGAQS